MRVTPRPLVLLAPGAGAPSTSAWMERWARHLSALGRVRRFDYPYALAGRRSPDPLPVLVEAHRAALARARAR
ncbi:MAG TPA: alpha/beta family hydrolase, partial [Anaeromyxobacteraceae bacterium]|nr:alpha/beta family hydrolase [Anaeromyxobacteraceae bacterium]